MRGGMPGRGGYGGPPGGGGGGFNVAALDEMSKITDATIRTFNSSIKGKGLRVRTIHLPTNKTFKVPPFPSIALPRRDETRGLAWQVVKLDERSAVTLSFTVERPDEEPVTTTVAEYFAKKYQRLRYPNLPCLQVCTPSPFALVVVGNRGVGVAGGAAVPGALRPPGGPHRGAPPQVQRQAH